MPLVQPKIKPPSRGTLAKYGLTLRDWWLMAERQEYTCPVCQQPFGERKLVIDHEHVAGWRARKRRKSKKLHQGKRKDIKLRVMTPQQRRPYVRGILHAWCNGWIRSWLTLSRTRSILTYLEAYEGRKTDAQG